MTSASEDQQTGTAPRPVVLGERPLTVEEVVQVARRRASVEIAEAARERMVAGRAAVDSLASGQTPAYGVSTGFGALADRKIDVDSRERLQASLVRSHAAGTGAEVEEETTRALMLLRLQTLTTGRTGVEMEAIIAAQVAAATIYDMCKAVQKDMVIRDVRLVHKSGGRTGTFERRESSGERT